MDARLGYLPFLEFRPYEHIHICSFCFHDTLPHKKSLMVLCRGTQPCTPQAITWKFNLQRTAGLHRARQEAFCKVQRVLCAMRFRFQTIGRGKEGLWAGPG